MKKNLPKILLVIAVFSVFLSAGEPKCHANIERVARGAVKTVSSVFYIPAEIIKDSGTVMFPFSIVTGTVKGAFKMVGGVLSGAVDLATGAAPYAKYLVFL